MKPVITEKSTAAVAQNCYTFKVDKKVTKGQIKKTAEEKFKVDVVRVRTINAKQWKKAIVEIKKGQKIENFEGKHEK